MYKNLGFAFVRVYFCDGGGRTLREGGGGGEGQDRVILSSEASRSKMISQGESMASKASKAASRNSKAVCSEPAGVSTVHSGSFTAEYNIIMLTFGFQSFLKHQGPCYPRFKGSCKPFSQRNFERQFGI